jgi:oligosaccharide repeat unit polymerase
VKLSEILRFTFSTPIRVMLSTWLITFIVFFSLPVSYEHGPRLSTVLYLAACLGGFVYGNLLFRLAHADAPSEISQTISIEVPLRIFAVLGILGAVLVGIDKIVLGNLDLSQGLGALRFVLQSEEEVFKQRSLALWIGSALYSFSNVALVLYLLEGEKVNRVTAVLALVSSLSPAFVIVLYGGRSSAILLALSFFGTCLVRLASRQPLLPKTGIVRLFLVLYCGAILLGSLYIFTARAEILQRTREPEVDALYAWMERSNMEISVGLGTFLNNSGRLAGVVANVLLAGIYGTHGLAELDYLLNENADAGPFWGLYQGWLVNKALSVAFAVPDLTDTFASAIHHNGLFFTAWGAMLLDLGPLGSPFAFIALGVLSGWLYVRGVAERSLTARMALAFLYMYILVSPLHSAISMGNGLLMLANLVLASIALRLNAHKDLAAGGGPSAFDRAVVSIDGPGGADG